MSDCRRRPPLPACVALLATLLLAACASTPEPGPTTRFDPVGYGGGDAQGARTLAVSRPADQRTRPGVLIIHGGGWDDGEPADMEAYVERVLAAGWVAINLGYRLAPEHTWPAQRGDLHAAQQAIVENAARWGVDPERIGVLGYSAGAHMAALAAYEPNPRTPPPVVVAAGAGPFDLTQFPESPIVRKFLGGVPSAVGTQVYRDASPLFKVNAQVPPTALWHGTWDTLVPLEQSRRLASALRAVEVPVELHERFARGHFTNFLLDEDDWGEIRDFMARALEAPR